MWMEAFSCSDKRPFSNRLEQQETDDPALDGGLDGGHGCPGVRCVWFCDMERRCHPRLEALMVRARLPVPSRTSSRFPPDRERLHVTLSVFPATSTNLF